MNQLLKTFDFFRGTKNKIPMKFTEERKILTVNLISGRYRWKSRRLISLKKSILLIPYIFPRDGKVAKYNVPILSFFHHALGKKFRIILILGHLLLKKVLIIHCIKNLIRKNVYKKKVPPDYIFALTYLKFLLMLLKFKFKNGIIEIDKDKIEVFWRHFQPKRCKISRDSVIILNRIKDYCSPFCCIPMNSLDV